MVYGFFVLLLLSKVLWGYWTRDLTFGDTASYFRDASSWARSREINIVWSPLYTAYFGSWVSLLDDAVAATLMHRIVLIALSTVLVAWLGYITLPRVLAIALVIWWAGMPIHYDTLYEVHLFGTLPLLLLLLFWQKLSENWRLPVCIALTLATAILVRNEYVVLLVVLCATVVWRIAKGQDLDVREKMFTWAGRFGVCLALAIALVAGVYQMSYIKGEMVGVVSKPKHTLNMCQVYAFGYQQRHPEWAHSPWTDCEGLMQLTFDQPLPSLSQMALSNPVALAEHFAWNLGLFPSGVELLLFNVIAEGDNPDYAEAVRWSSYPSWALAGLVVWAIWAAGVAVRRYPDDNKDIRDEFLRFAPIILGSVLMVLAVVLTQRPRPSYLLGFGVLLVWSFGMLLTAAWPRLKGTDLTLWPVFVALMALAFVPSYASLPLPSKSGMLGALYELARPHRETLCRSGGVLALNEYAYELSTYLCSPLRDVPREGDVRIMNLNTLASDGIFGADALVETLRVRDVRALIVDPSFFDKVDGMKSCALLRDTLLAGGWSLLAYSELNERRCFAYYARLPNS